MPVVGAAKNVVELARGRDFFPDRRRRDAPLTVRRYRLPIAIQPAQ